MRNRLKNNIKIKLISLLSALVLWLYVMTIEDPVESRTFSDIPVRITNMSVLEERGLAIYPKEKLVADISIKGNLSSLRPINKNNIYIYGRIEDSKEGKNVVYLQANLPERVNKYDIKPNVITLDLEKIISEKRNISVYTEGKSKANIDNVATNKRDVSISGPKSLVNKVEKLIVNINVDNKEKDFSKKLKLIPIDKYGDEVKGIKINDNFIMVSVKFLKEKVVPIKLILESNDLKQINLDNYSLNPKEVVIEGKKESIDNLNEIKTKPININYLKNNIIDVQLDIPKGIKIKNNISNIKLSLNKNITSEFLISKYKIEIINKNNEIQKEFDLSKVPENIKIITIYSDEIKNLSPEDIKLYVDIDENSQNKGKYFIKYKSKYELKDVKIEPNSIEF